jgi:hypothetical protein
MPYEKQTTNNTGTKLYTPVLVTYMLIIAKEGVVNWLYNNEQQGAFCAINTTNDRRRMRPLVKIVTSWICIINCQRLATRRCRAVIPP